LDCRYYRRDCTRRDRVSINFDPDFAISGLNCGNSQVDTSYSNEGTNYLNQEWRGFEPDLRG